MRHASVRWLVMGSFMALASAGILATAQETPGAADVPEPMPVSDGTKVCLVCHGAKSGGGMGIYPAIAMQWEGSRHAQAGVGCLECHGVPEEFAGEDVDNPRYVTETAWDQTTGLKSTTLVTDGSGPVVRPDIWHHGGADIVVAVSPKSCAQCHPTEAEELYRSRHSSAGQFLGSVGNFLGRYAEGPAAAINGCQQCHGGPVLMAAEQPTNESLAPVYAADTWPNSGVGRINPDGSWGACAACHARHEFSAATARRPENCGKCHMGPDHPQSEIYKESKHGIAYDANRDSLDIDVPGGEWVLGETYANAPTCSSCHMGPVGAHFGSKGLPLTHDVGARISWTLRPELSYQPAAIVDTDGEAWLKAPEERRDEMRQTCLACHGDNWVESFYTQYDQAVELYNNKYAKPMMAIYQFLSEQGIIDDVPMNDEIDYLYYELWHHEGRRARHGAAMMGPDYVHWHGFYEMTRHFYTEFLPLAMELGEAAGKGAETEAFIETTLRGEDGQDWERYHRWTEGLTAEQREEMLRWERAVYGGIHTE
ncbi:MAG: hydroxylamine oxidoreductase [Armatimonadetes bacterium]|jgi:hydroxylamine dehydrogenase|nr:hydroxylamine oxidoreductase [Armatimonadota bacterium]MDI9601630.1 multiheme c-type cytochrome [Acidobacteriota bacterium]NLN90196.1 hydroxylamine oxidoreductase [candidate division WS1 bacterium]